MRRARLSIGALFFLFLLGGAGCAINLSEARSARVLRGGEIQVSEVNNMVVPTRAFADIIDPAKAAIEAADEDRELSMEEKRTITKGATAIALSSPGYGAHLDVGLGLGYRFDTWFFSVSRARPRISGDLAGPAERGGAGPGRGVDPRPRHCRLPTRR